MFGLAIWDVRQSGWFLPGPVWIKLITTGIDAGNSLYFGSEMRPIRASCRA